MVYNTFVTATNGHLTGKTVTSRALVLRDSMVLNFLVFNIRSCLDYQRRAAFSNAVQTKNCYHIICLTWLSEHISNSALFLPSYEVHRKDRPSDNGNTKNGDVLYAVTKNIITIDLVFDFYDCIIIFHNLNSPIICASSKVTQKLVATHGRLISFANLSNS